MRRTIPAKQTMTTFLPIAVLLYLLVTGATADGYGSQTTTSPSTATPYTSTPTTPPPPPPPPTSQHATPPKPVHDYDDDKKLVVAVLVEGLVLCQTCTKRGSQSPLRGAKVAVTCRGRNNRVMEVVTDNDGYFHAEFGVDPADDYLGKDPRGACFVRLLSSPDPKCNVIHDGLQGVPLRHEGKHWIVGRGFKKVVHTIHPLTFKPAKCAPTHH